MDMLFLLHQTVCGAIAAAGFGVLFNIGFRSLPWCAASGALTLFVRTICLDHGWNLEASSFFAALTVGSAVHILRRYTVISENALDVAGCIPMVPGSFAAKAILGLFALTSTDQSHLHDGRAGDGPGHPHAPAAHPSGPLNEGLPGRAKRDPSIRCSWSGHR